MLTRQELFKITEEVLGNFGINEDEVSEIADYLLERFDEEGAFEPEDAPAYDDL